MELYRGFRMAYPRLEENKHMKGTEGENKHIMRGKRRRKNVVYLNKEKEQEFVLVRRGKL